jgi:transposase
MEVRAIGIELGKSMFHFVAGDARGLIGMEAGAGAHYLGRRLLAQVHDVRLVPAQYVRPYVKSSNKNDTLDAEGIVEAV